MRVEIACPHRRGETERGRFVRSRLRIRQAEPDRNEPQDGAKATIASEQGRTSRDHEVNHGDAHRRVKGRRDHDHERRSPTASRKLEQTQATGIWKKQPRKIHRRVTSPRFTPIRSTATRTASNPRQMAAIGGDRRSRQRPGRCSDEGQDAEAASPGRIPRRTANSQRLAVIQTPYGRAVLALNSMA